MAIKASAAGRLLENILILPAAFAFIRFAIVPSNLSDIRTGCVQIDGVQISPGSSRGNRSVLSLIRIYAL